MPERVDTRRHGRFPRPSRPRGTVVRVTDGPRCPHCGTEVLPHWDWCHDCGYDPDGLRASTHEASPTEPPAGRVSSPRIVAALAVAVVLLVGAFAWSMRSGGDSDGEEAIGTGPAPELVAEGETSPIDDGWWQLDTLDERLAIELPGPVDRTAMTLELLDGTELPAVGWFGTASDTDALWGLVLAPRVGEEDVELDADEDMHDVIVPDVGGGVLLGPRQALTTTLDASPDATGYELRATSAGSGMAGRAAVVSADGHLLVVIHTGDPDDATFERMLSTLRADLDE